MSFSLYRLVPGFPPMSDFDHASCWTKAVEQDKRDQWELKKATGASKDCVLSSTPYMRINCMLFFNILLANFRPTSLGKKE